ncbi:hypothetical protein [Mycolicibacterium gilvum]|uniref:hypothetical protein n=1 Tax=Mycolicibacterium gilvum TaxID=1804 RepID=UPI004045293E
MASIAGFRPWPRWPPRWTLRWALPGLFRKAPATSAVAVVESASRRPDLRKRRNYAPPRDSFFETAAMRREMYRL